MDLTTLSAAFRTRLRERGYARASGALDFRRISERFAAYSQRFESLPHGHAIHVAPGGIEARWRRLLASAPAPLHPLRFLVPLTWLFDGWTDWTRCYDAVRHPCPVDDAVDEPTSDEAAPRRGAFFRARAAGSSIRAAAGSAGVDPQTGITWALQAGMPVQRRPKRVTRAMRKSIERQLGVGKPKEMIASHHGVSVTTVTRILLSTPGLRDARQEHADRHRLGKARKAIQACVTAHQGIGRKELHLSEPAAYAWLYRHDRTWLADVLRSRPTQEDTRRRHVDWCGRDATLTQSLEALRRSGPPLSTWSSRVALAREVPDLRSQLRHLDRLPRTAALIGQLVPRARQLGSSAARQVGNAVEFIFPKIRHDELLAGYRARIASWNGCTTSTELARALTQAFPERAIHDKTIDFVQIAAWRNGLTPATLMQQHSCRHVQSRLVQGTGRFDSLRAMSVSWSLSMYAPDQRVRACPDCIAEDLAQRPYAYWRRNHQVPGLYACSRHSSDLVLSEALDMPAAWPDEAIALPAPFTRHERLALDGNRYVQAAIAFMRQLVERKLVIEPDTSALVLRQHLVRTLNGMPSHAALMQIMQDRFGAAWISHVLPRAQGLYKGLIEQCLLQGRSPHHPAVAMLASIAFESAQAALMHLGAQPLPDDAADDLFLADTRPRVVCPDALAIA